MTDVEDENVKLRAENALLRKYAVLLGEEVDSAVPMAHIHGWRSTDERIKEGERLRKELGIADTADLRQLP